MKNVNKNVCVSVVGTLLLVLSSSFSYGNNVKQNFDSYGLTFEVLDLDNDGYITRNELEPLLPPLLNGLISNQVLSQIIRIYDFDRDGKISPTEFDITGGSGPLEYILSNIV